VSTLIRDWGLSISSPEWAEWLTVLAYLIAAILCNRAVPNAVAGKIVGDQRFWGLTAGLLALLGINEVLDLQKLLTLVARAHAKTHGWYGEHRKYQYLFILTLTCVAMTAGSVIAWRSRAAHFSVRLALLGLVVIGLFALSRAASFHHVLDLLGGRLWTTNLASMLELSGIVIVAVAAVIYQRQIRSRG
jgi:hypothetical protein